MRRMFRFMVSAALMAMVAVIGATPASATDVLWTASKPQVVMAEPAPEVARAMLASDVLWT